VQSIRIHSKMPALGGGGHFSIPARSARRQPWPSGRTGQHQQPGQPFPEMVFSLTGIRNLLLGSAKLCFKGAANLWVAAQKKMH